MMPYGFKLEIKTGEHYRTMNRRRVSPANIVISI
jgi:hypothetical protein